MRRYFADTFASLRIRNYRLFFIGQSISQSGNWMQKLAQAWLVLELTGSAPLLGLVTAVQQIPTLLLSPYAGLLADRHKKRTILIIASVLGFIPSFVLGLLTLTHHVSIVVVFALALLGGVADAHSPARHAFVSELVGREHLPNAVNLTQVIQEAGKAVGPAIGGLLIALVGIPFTFLFNALTFIAVLVALLMMDPTRLKPGPAASRESGQFRASLRYVRSNPELSGPLMLLAAAGLLGYNFQVLLPLLGKEVLHGDARTAGWLLGALGTGATISGILLAGVLRPVMRTVIAVALAFGALFVATGLAPNQAVAIVLVACLGGVSVLFKTRTSTWLQLRANPEMRGRVLALLVVALAGTTPIGAPLTGLIADLLGTRAAFIIAGVCVVLAAAGNHLFLKRHSAKLATRSPLVEEAAAAAVP